MDAQLRCEFAASFLRTEGDDYTVVTTGGFGSFNESFTPHWVLMKKNLIALGVHEDVISAGVHSSGTYQDAIGVARIVNENPEMSDVAVVSSDYHIARVRKIFGHFLPFVEIRFLEVPSDKDRSERNRKSDHEQWALKEFQADKVNLASALNTQSEDFSRLHEEIKHYDSLSYFTTAALFIFIAYFFQDIASRKVINLPSDNLLLGIAFLAFLVSLCLLSVYLRFSATAASARRTLSTLEFYFQRGGLSSARARLSRLSLKIRASVIIIFLAAWAMNLLLIADRVVIQH